MSTSKAKKHIIIGTSGHIDHGKTSLVKALTGVDADVLVEEKKRGITIELGFVFMKTPNENEEIIFIDVPGHEKLVKTMVAGAANLDSVLFVVAADEGINLQTEEHFDILKLLDIPNGIIAVTKSDLADEHQTEFVIESMKEFVAGSFLEGAPIIPVSSITGDGIEEIREALFSVAGRVRKRVDNEVFRMPVDRVFTMQGFGTVVAGTILSGDVKIGDDVEVYPDGIKTKIRGVQVHGEKSDTSTIGKRTAINLLNVDKKLLHRGQCVGTPGTLLPTERIDGKFHTLSTTKPVKNLTRLRFYTGTSETICRLSLLDRDKLSPGETAPAQFVLAGKTVAQPGDRFVIRSLSPLTTIGGGTILDANPSKHKRFAKDVLEGLERLEGGILRQTEQIVYQSGMQAIDLKNVFLRVGRLRKDVEEAIEVLLKDKTIFLHQDEKTKRFLHAKFYDDLKERFIRIARTHLEKNPDQLESPFNELRSEMLEIIDSATFKFIMSHLTEEKKIERKGIGIVLCDYEVPVSAEEKEIGEKIEKRYLDAGIESPLESKVCEDLGMDLKEFKKIMASLINRKRVIRLTPKVTYHVQTFGEIEQKVLNFIEKNTSITVAQFRDELGLSRKYAQAILEYCDEAGITKRTGDQHVLPD